MYESIACELRKQMKELKNFQQHYKVIDNLNYDEYEDMVTFFNVYTKQQFKNEPFFNTILPKDILMLHSWHTHTTNTEVILRRKYCFSSYFEEFIGPYLPATKYSYDKTRRWYRFPYLSVCFKFFTRNIRSRKRLL